MKQWFVYILASRRNGTLYVGVTGDLPRRMAEHRGGTIDGFTSRHDVKVLVHVETFDDPRYAIEREKRLKKWNRAWKMGLIESHNPDWRDLHDSIL